MLTLHHAPLSRSSRIIWLLEELKADYDLVYTDISRRDGSGRSDPGNPHPDKKVPALVHDGALVTESAAITLYLTDLHPTAGLGPVVGDPRRGAYLTWLAYYAGVMEPVLVMQFAGLASDPLVHHTFRGRDEIDARIVSALRAGPFLLGERFSAVDVLIGSSAQWARGMLPPGDVVDSYIARIADRPARLRAQAKETAPA